MTTNGQIKQTAWFLFLSAFVAIILLAIGTLVVSNMMFLGAHDFLHYLEKSGIVMNLSITLWTASTATVLAMLTGIPVGYALSRFHFPSPRLLRTVIDLPVMVPPAAIGVFLLGTFTHPPLSTITHFLGLRVDHALPGVIVAQYAVTVSFCIRLAMASFDTISPHHEHVARCLGASLPRTFFTVSLPMARNGILASLIIVWARAAAEWESLMLFVGGIQGRTDVMPFTVYLDFTGGKLGRALTVSLFCIVIAVVSMTAVHVLSGRQHA